MDIKKIAAYSDQKPARLQEAELRPTEQTKTITSKTTSPTEGSDRVAISRGYQEIDKIKKAVTEMSDIRPELVDHYQKMIQSGVYEVKPAQVAEKILEDML
jgi:flagellar biosynthesis anti-sigma factor FlgM